MSVPKSALACPLSSDSTAAPRRGAATPRRGHVRRAFTLVELLLVIAVIVILLALLLPAISQSRSSAKTAECQNNLKQLHSALMTAQKNEIPVSNANWIEMIHPYLSPGDHSFLCPEDLDSGVGSDATTPTSSSYGLSNRFARLDTGDSEKIVLLDYHAVTANVVGPTAADNWLEMSDPRHRNQMNVLYYGGAVQLQAQDDIDPTVCALHDQYWRPLRDAGPTYDRPDCVGASFVSAPTNSDPFATTDGSATTTDGEETTTTTTGEDPPPPQPPSADLSVELVDSSDPVQELEEFTYTITVDNNGPDTSTGVTVTYAIPNGTTLSADPVTVSQGNFNILGGTITASLGDIPYNGSATVDVKVTANAGAAANFSPLHSTAIVSSGTNDPQPLNNEDDEYTEVEAPPPPPPSGCPGDTTVTNGLIVHLKFDEAAALGLDSSPMGSHFTPDSQMATAVDDPDRCGVVRFTTGTSVGLRNIGSSPINGLSAITVTYWYKYDASGGTDQVVVGGSWGSLSFFYLLSGGQRSWIQAPSSSHVDANASPNAGQWNHVAGARNSSGILRAWINGSTSMPSVTSCAADPPTSPCQGFGGSIANRTYMTIAGLDNPAGTGWAGFGKTGTFDDFRIYNRVLSDAEVQTIMNETMAP